MSQSPISGDSIVFRPVTLEEWDDMQALFSQMGALEGCWCMYWRKTRSEFSRQFGSGNKAAMKNLLESGEVPGILAYHKGRPVAWCSVAPRSSFPVLDRSPTLKRVDSAEVWSVVCFFVAKEYRKMGLMERLIGAAIRHAASRGARIVEAYPILPEKSSNPKYEVYTGVFSVFKKMGFKKVCQRSKIRPIVRYTIG